MVVGVPLAKLGVLAIRQLSKPFAQWIARRAKNNYYFRTYICMPTAQSYHRFEVRTKMWAMNMHKPEQIEKLDENAAIESGATILGEFIIFSIGVLLVSMEYARQVKKDSAKEQARLDAWNELENKVNCVCESIQGYEQQVHQLKDLLQKLEKSMNEKVKSKT
ncbi:putative OPA3-like protein CG13603 [Artemia franciscana]|uniref:OPA3-like protein n=1 Tax=Artemia franciscana TaxID=6661 RepID=A0AA88KVW1_ARTSF|nr:hypothetical protein QYM36_015831 [Artemia franciscana]